MNKTDYYKSKTIALLLAFFLGGYGIHQFYLGNKKIAITQLVLTILGYLTVVIGIGIALILAVGVWAIVDMIRIILADEDGFDWSFSEVDSEE